MSDRNLQDWISDQLYTLLGYSADAATSYVSALARRAPNVNALVNDLQAQGGLPANSGTRQFAQELLDRLPGKSGSNGRAPVAAPTQRVQEAAARAFLKQNAQYGLLLEDDDADEAAPDLPAPTTAALPKKKNKKLKKDKTATDDVEEDGVNLAAPKRRKRTWEEASDDEAADPEALEAARKEAEMEADRLEREAFEQRLKERDDAKTRKMAEAKLSKEDLADIKRRQYETEEEKQNIVPELRVFSRQEYLKKREDKKIEELEADLQDAEMLFAGEKLSRKEQDDIEYKRRVLELAKKRKQAQEDLNRDDGYHMPTAYDKEGAAPSERYKVLTERYREPEEDDSAPWKEQENWEGDQIRRALQKAGNKDRKPPAEQYEYVFEDQIDFITDAAAKGEMDLETVSPEEAAQRIRDAEALAKMAAHERIQAERRNLPMYKFRTELMEAIAQYQVIIVVAETGSGKTTQIPQYLHEDGYTKIGRVGCTQPRRVAAMSVAKRVSEEMGKKLGREVGYSIRFEDNTSDDTVIKYMTDGMLLRELLTEPDLATYSVMMIDEAHERTLHTDVLFGLVKDLARFRPDFKLLISSATLDAKHFSEFFDHAPIFRVPGRRYPVDINYTKAPEANYLDAAVITALQIHATQPAGDVLIFLTGQEEIEAAEELLKLKTKGLGSKIGELMITPVYANLPSDMQTKIFEPTPPGARKIVLATNIAETSLTIDGIKFVIDPGFVKQNSYNPRSGMESLIVTPISQAAANQRAGRAGRTSAGKSFRLFTMDAYRNQMSDTTVPEIQRTNLGNVVLMLKSLGINDLMNFDFMDPPPSETLMRALEQLYALGALNDKGELTKLGRRMAEFPLDPMLAKMICASEKYQCSEEIVTIAAMVSAGSGIFYRPKDKAVFADNAHQNFHRGNVGDHIALLTVYNSWAETAFSAQWCYENYVQVKVMKRVRDIREQLLGLMDRTEIELVSNLGDHDAIKKAIAAGFFYNTARLRKDGAYRTIKNPQTIHIHPSSGLTKMENPPRWIVYHELVLTSKEYARTVTEIRPDWLLEIAPHMYSSKDIAADLNKKVPKTQGRAAMDA